VFKENSGLPDWLTANATQGLMRHMDRMKEKQKVDSVCVYCGSADDADQALIREAGAFGVLLAQAGIRLVYGGGGVGLMGACAKAAHEAGGRVLGVMPEFLRAYERLYDEVETRVVETMRERKQILFEEADAFVALPGGVGTLEEVIELLSWRKLALHNKPVVFFSPDGFWDPLFRLFEHMVENKVVAPSFLEMWRTVDRIEDILPAIHDQLMPGATIAKVI